MHVCHALHVNNTYMYDGSRDGYIITCIMYYYYYDSIMINNITCMSTVLAKYYWLFIIRLS